MKERPHPASSQLCYVGIDFSKEKFNYDGAGRAGSAPNEPLAHRRFLAQLPPGAHLICESTGACHRALVLTAHRKGVPVSVVNPAQVKHFLQGLGQRAKSDPLDAHGLRRFGEVVQPLPDPLPSPTALVLQELVVARQQVVQERATLQVQAATQTMPWLRGRTKARLQQLKAEEARLDAQIAKTLAQDPALADRAARLETVAGVGPVTAATCVALCPELGHLSRQEAAALLGVAPYIDASGQVSRPRHISGGRFRLRCVLYMAALSATRCNPILREFFLHLRQEKKAAKVALVAVMRKLFQLLNHLLKHPDFQLTVAQPKTAATAASQNQIGLKEVLLAT